MKFKDDSKNYVIMALCAILLVMSVGYAAFNSLLRINATASLTSSFCVGFDNTKTNTYTATAGLVGAPTPTGSMTYSGTACSTKYVPNASLIANFKQPGDKIEYTLTIANKSTFGVAINSIIVENQSVTSKTTITKGNVKYIVDMPLSTTLASNAETTMKVTAMFQDDTNVTGNYTGETQTLNVQINAGQDSGSGGFTPTFTGTIYRWSTENWALNQNISNKSEGTDYVTSVSDVTNMNSRGANFYLKHEVVNDVITENYVCFVGNKEYCIRGGVDECGGRDAEEECMNTGSKPVASANNATMTEVMTWLTASPQSGACPERALDSWLCNGGIFSAIGYSSEGYVGVESINDYSSCSIDANGTLCSLH